VFNGISQPNNHDINYYYPTSVLVTGQDIIFFWVARMIMAGMEYKQEKPFEYVYFTGMVRDKQGRKMSKSLGNSPDLLELIDRFGADAVRFGILISAPAGNDLLFDDSSCEQGKFFNNKIWNALKLLKMWEANGVAVYDRNKEDVEKATFAATWFEARLNQVKNEVETLYKEFKLSEALKTIYSLIWDDFCSWYLEWVKPPFGQPIDQHLYTCTVNYFEQLMQMLHPFMPFITEEIYHHLRDREKGNDLAISQFGTLEEKHINLSQLPVEKVLHLGDILKDVITAIRDVRNKNNMKPKDAIRLSIQSGNQQGYELVADILAKQVNADEVNFVSDVVANSINTVVGKDKFYIQAEMTVDVSVQKEQLLKDLEYQKGFLEAVNKKLANERFVQNAKPEIVENERKKKNDAELKIKAIEESLSAL
jgi:valyl-tRNA synthetase